MGRTFRFRGEGGKVWNRRNLAARLCAEAKNGQILIAGRVAAAVEKVIVVEDLGSLALKGLTQPVSAFNVPLAATPPALRVIEGGPQSV